MSCFCGAAPCGTLLIDSLAFSKYRWIHLRSSSTSDPRLCSIGRHFPDGRRPDQLILISPLTTCSFPRPIDEAMARIEPKDWWVSRSFAHSAGKWWLGTSSSRAATLERFFTLAGKDSGLAKRWQALLLTTLDHPLLSPVLHASPFELLRSAGTHVTLVGAKNDTLYVHAAHYAPGM